MKKIDISTPKYPNTFTLVDDGDYKALNVHKWTATGYGKKIYARRTVQVNGKQTTFLMHIVIMGQIDNKEIDHREGNGLDNQRRNLRHCTHADNIKNRDVPINNTSGYKGVSWKKDRNKWQSTISHNRKLIYLGIFFCLIKAAKAYDQAAIKYYGEYAKLNFPENSTSK